MESATSADPSIVDPAPAPVDPDHLHRPANLYTRSNIALGVESQGLSAACNLGPLAAVSAA